MTGRPDIKYWPGYMGAFTRAQEGDWPNGGRVEKDSAERGDSTPNGVQGTILGSLKVEDMGELYFIEWDNRPTFAVGCARVKLKYIGGGTVRAN